MKIRVLRALLGAVATGVCACQLSVPPCSSAPTAAPAPPPVAEYLVVEYTQGSQSIAPPDVAIKGTPKYDEKRTSLQSVAIRAPDSCFEEAGAKITAAGQTQTLLKTVCGPWLSELEKALAVAGYKVFSWDAVKKAEGKGETTYDAAKKLGADVVFIFNSLEATDIKAGDEAQGRYRYFASNSRGDELAPKPLDDASRADFKAFAVQASGKPDAQRIVALQSNIDVTAVLPGSGESVWFYRRSVMFPVGKRGGMKFLFGRLGAQPWRAVSPDVPVQQTVVMQPQLTSEETVHSTVGTELDPYKTERNALIQQGASEFVRSFQSGAK